jgi:hypothetical protein
MTKPIGGGGDARGRAVEPEGPQQEQVSGGKGGAADDVGPGDPAIQAGPPVRTARPEVAQMRASQVEQRIRDSSVTPGRAAAPKTPVAEGEAAKPKKVGFQAAMRAYSSRIGELLQDPSVTFEHKLSVVLSVLGQSWTDREGRYRVSLDRFRKKIDELKAQGKDVTKFEQSWSRFGRLTDDLGGLRKDLVKISARIQDMINQGMADLIASIGD